MKILIFFSVLLFSGLIVNAQSVSINNDGSAPDTSAMLDVKSINKGLLIPRMTTVQRTAITAPKAGLQVFDITTSSLWFYNGSAWNALSAGSSTNYWTPNGSNIFNNNAGNVGIGLTTPLAPLHIKKDLEALRIEGSSPYLSFYNTAGTVSKSFMQSTGDNLYLGTSTGNISGIIQLYANANPLMTILPSGKVGIGTSLPVEPLTVQTTNNTFGISHRGEGGNILATRMGGTSAGIGTFSNTHMRIFTNSLAAITITGNNGNVGIGTEFQDYKLAVQTLNNSNGIAHLGEGGNILATRMGGTSAGMGTFSNTNMRIFCNSRSDIFIAAATGNVGIGYENYGVYKLAVNGTIKSKEIIVETANWPDYVFDEKYDLTPLSEVEKYIDEYKHLPNMISAKQMEQTGLHLGDIQKKMMEKIEELTLYLIAANKEIKMATEEIASLKVKVSILETPNKN